MYVSNSLTLPPLLSLYVDFLRGGVEGLFFWLGARHIKGGGRELGSYRRRNDDQRRAPSDIPLAAAGAAGLLPPYVNRACDIPIAAVGAAGVLQVLCQLVSRLSARCYIFFLFFSFLFLFFLLRRGQSLRAGFFWKGG